MEEQLPDFLQDDESPALSDEPLVMRESKPRTILPTNYYEATIKEAGLTKNPFYNPEKENPGTPEQMQVTFEVEHSGETISLRHWTSTTLSDGSGGYKRSYLYSLLTAAGIDPKSSPKPSELVGKKVKINVVIGQKKDGSDFNKVVGGTYEPITT